MNGVVANCDWQIEEVESEEWGLRWVGVDCILYIIIYYYLFFRILFFVLENLLFCVPPPSFPPQPNLDLKC